MWSPNSSSSSPAPTFSSALARSHNISGSAARGKRGRGASCAAVPTEAVALLSEAPAAGIWWQDPAAAAFGVVGGRVWVKLFEELASRGVIEQKLSRKLVHTTAGPLLVLTWLLYSGDDSARYWACLAPAINATRLAAVGSGVIVNEKLVKSVSRENDPRELLRGPLYYCLVLMAATGVFWRTSPVGFLMLSLMCGGDGAADIVGRRFGTVKLPVNPRKSWAGSAALLVAGAGMSAALLQLFASLGYLEFDLSTAWPALIGVALVGAIVECLPVSDDIDDNLSVPVATCIAALLVL